MQILRKLLADKPKKTFFAILSIACKETRETHYWIHLLSDTGYLSREDKVSLMADVDELLKIIGSIQETVKVKLQNS